MASRGTTFAKQDRDRAKKAKAAAKRERREDRAANPESADADTEIDVSGDGDVSPEELLRLVAELHKAFDEERISFEEFEERKQELMARISV